MNREHTSPNLMFELATRSVKKPGKIQNGDHALVRDQGEGLVALAVADGAGFRPCDWRASEVACAAALEGIQEATQEATGPLARQIEAGIRKAHWTVDRETGRCEGMLAAVALAAWPRGSVRESEIPEYTGCVPTELSR
jgi:serine/threonine protein phosphatase PrpC